MEPSRTPNRCTLKKAAYKEVSDQRNTLHTFIPPPAYSPQRQTLSSPRLRSAQVPIRMISHDPPTTSVADGSEIYEAEDTEDRSQIRLHVNTSVVVSDSSNVICLPSCPSDQAQTITQAVFKALQENSAGQCGMPMIDEDGRPRPILVDIDASMAVTGANNVVGTAAVIKDFFIYTAATNRQKDVKQGNGESFKDRRYYKRRRLQ